MATQAAVDTNRPRAEETEAFLQQRIAAFTRIFTPQDEAQEIEIAQTVLASIRLEHYQLCEVDRRIEIAQIARDPGSAWDEARQQEASCLGKTLKRDPEIVMMSLRETPAGRAWLITQWEALLLVIDSGGELIWTDGESNRALDLMGTSRDYRAALIKCRSPFADPVATRVLILERIAMLKTAQQRDKADNDRLRSTHVRGLVTHGDAKINLIRRCEREAQRRYDRNLKSLYKAKAAQAKAAKEQPAPAYETKPNPGGRRTALRNEAKSEGRRTALRNEAKSGGRRTALRNEAKSGGRGAALRNEAKSGRASV